MSGIVLTSAAYRVRSGTVVFSATDKALNLACMAAMVAAVAWP